jgi:hypothetical protein
MYCRFRLRAMTHQMKNHIDAGKAQSYSDR